jgi:diaminopimelate decarboxylase
MTRQERIVFEEKHEGMSYRQAIELTYGHLPIFQEIVQYDGNGDLVLNGLHIPELIKELEEAPIELVMPVMVEKRANEWRELAEKVRSKVRYGNELGYLVASKASPEAATMIPALQAGWDMETSAGQDLSNLGRVFADKDLGVPQDLRIVCNGPKLHEVIDPDGDLENEKTRYDGRVDVPFKKGDPTYAELIVDFHEKGRNIVPVLDGLSELDFLETGAKKFDRPMKVGLRFKSYGLPKNDNNPDTLVSRHGMSTEQMFEAAERVTRNPNLTLDTFHAMVGAAEVMDIDTFVDSLMVCAERYFDMAEEFPSLTRFNMGGGVPPMGFGWGHEEFLTKFLKRMNRMAKKRKVRPPVIDFEFGSLLAAESSHHVIYASEEKINHVDGRNPSTPWQYIEGSFMRMIPDTWVIGKNDWIILAANNANLPVREVRLGGVTCDSDDVWPPKGDERKGIESPEKSGTKEKQLYVILATGAYQKQLTGIDGVGHCTLKEAAAVICYEADDGEYRFLPLETKNRERARKVLGYTKRVLDIFK